MAVVEHKRKSIMEQEIWTMVRLLQHDVQYALAKFLSLKHLSKESSHHITRKLPKVALIERKGLFL